MLPVSEHRISPTRYARIRTRMVVRDERGFTLVELLIVMVMLAILMTIGFATFQGTQRTGRVKAITSAASAYQNAVTQFQLDHGNRAPKFGGGAGEWRSNQNAYRGPIVTYDTQLPTTPGTVWYMRRIPVAVGDKLASVHGLADNLCDRTANPAASCPVPAGTSVPSQAIGTVGAIVYQRTGETTYRILVYAAPGRQKATNANLVFVCAVGNDPELGTQC